MTEIEQPSQNGIDLSAAEDDDSSKARPADIEQDMREMERRKRVEAIMNSKLFREELERIVDSARDSGGASGILQQLSDIVGVPSARIGSVFKASNCLLPINDIRGVESMGYAKGEKILRCKLAATFRLLDLYGWTQGLGAQITARLKVDQEYFLVNPYGLLYHEITASSLNKVDMQGQIVEQGTTNFGVNKSHFVLHSVVHAARPDIRCAIYIGCSPVVAISSLKTGLLPLTEDACVLGEITTHPYSGSLLDEEERNKLVRNLGPNSKVMLLTNHGALCCGETIEEAFFAACHIVQACETQLKLLPVGLDNLVLIPEESRKVIYDQSRRPPEDLEKKFATAVSVDEDSEAKDAQVHKVGAAPKWRVGGAEFEALMRMLDNAGYRTGYIYRHPLIKSDPPKPKNDVELPPAVSSLGYLLEEEELFRQGIWKKGDLRKGGDRSRWLNSPNVYQKVEVLETGTPDPKKITKWVAEGSPTHSTPVRIEDPLQFVPAGTNPKEFKRLQQQIKDNRRADKISAGPQSHILEGVTWDEANRIKDATVSSTGDHVVLMGAASKGIIQRGYQHNATVYKAPYAKNPFDNVTDDELNEYKRTVERKKKSIHGEYTDTDFSESEALSSLPTSGAQQTKTAGVSQSEPEDMSEHQVMRIETQQAPVPSQPEVVLSDAETYSHSHSHSPPHTRSSTANCSISQSQLANALLSSVLSKEHEAKRSVDLREKYAFLYGSLSSDFSQPQALDVFVIHKIEPLCAYTYPLSHVNAAEEETNPSNAVARQQEVEPVGHGKNTTGGSLAVAPYRTVSHYGFNYPLTYLPNIQLQPELMLSGVELQRQKIIAFINSTMLNYANELQRRQRKLGKLSAAEVDNNILGKDGNNNKNDIKCENVNNGSFISMKEIHLEPKSPSRRRHSKQSSHTMTEPDAEQDIGELLEQFSLLSVTDTYAEASNSHSGDHEHDDQFHDSGDNYSNVTASRHTGSDNLYRSYVLRNFLPSDHSHSYEHDIQHKPESEQALEVGIKNSRRTDPQQHQSRKELTLSVGRKKRSPGQRRERCETAESSHTDSGASLRSIEIHINVSIKNSDCVKSLQGHEREFKVKLEKAIDNEISLISQQLSQQHKRTFSSDPVLMQQFATGAGELGSNGTNNGHSSNCNNNNIDKKPTRRCDSAMEPLNSGDASNTISERKSRSAADIAMPSTPLIHLSTLHYRHTLDLLQHELENLLNSIARANELHNLAIMCDCKTKISRITDDIRSSLSLVKMNNTNY